MEGVVADYEQLVLFDLASYNSQQTSVEEKALAIRKVESLEQIEGFEPQQVAVVASSMDGSPIDPSTGGVKGKRPSKKDKLRAAAARAQ